MKTCIRLACALALWTVASIGHAQVGWREINSQGMSIAVSYPSSERNSTQMRGSFALQVAKNAPIKPAPSGAWPLIVMSHGTAGSSEPHHALSSALVQAGFVVVEPLHRGDNWQDSERAGPESWITRPSEVSEAITAIAQDGFFKAHVRADRVGVHGMSAGGVTALALAGGQWRVLSLVRHCAEQLDADVGFCLNGTAQNSAKQDKRRKQFGQAKMMKAVPDALLPKDMTQLHGGKAKADPRPDPRIAAVSLLVPVGIIFTPESLARIRIPMGITVAERDTVLVPRFHSGHVLAHCRSCKLLSSHPQAGHFDWFEPWPDDVARAVAAQQIRGGMPNSAFSASERQRGYAQIVRFFGEQLK
jgi:predicted dienelactone hydrolase